MSGALGRRAFSCGRCCQAAFVFGACVQAGSTLLKNFGDELPDLDERFLNGRINNKEDRPFLERETAVDKVLAELNYTTGSQGLNKPRLVALWSPRGTGKTSLVRQLAQSKQYADSRRYGRLLVFDALFLQQYLSTDADMLVSAIIIWHLLQFFHDYTVEFAPGQNVVFERRDFGPVLQLLKQSHSTPTPSGDSVLSWIASCCKSRDDVLDQWLSITEQALAAPKDCPRLLFLDQAELLASASRGQSHMRGTKSSLTDICSRLPQQMACFCTGTLNLIKGRPDIEYTKLVVCELAALAPLSRDAAVLAMKQWNGTQYDENVFNQIVFFSGGVPRLLRHAFETSGIFKSKAATAFNAMSKCFKGRMGLPDLVFLTQQLLYHWFFARPFGAAFPANNSVQVPRVWWCFDQAVRQQLQGELKALNIRLDRLLPDSLQLVASNNRGNVARGKPWEELVAHSLAARFHLYCMQRNWTANNTWAPFLEIYPTDNAHLKMVLEPFEVCWKDGVSYPQSEASVSDTAGHAIMCNVPFRNAHHDLLIPVKRVKCGTCEYIAAQCRYGAKKTAKDLNKTSQDKARKPKKNEARDTLPDMPNVLLQICPEKDGAQPFKAGTSWAKRQRERRYSLMSCKSIIAQLDVLRLL
ncbi:unnamed protein product [Symbiodinium sp. CCMP2456]|nr:unnamed protein product [Symbiodinium sp. CCMP2456]